MTISSISNKKKRGIVFAFLFKMNSTSINYIKRSTTDRRLKRFGGLRWLFTPGRRRHVRRKSDRNRVNILDYYPPKWFYFLVATLLLSVVDAFLTLWLIDHGAVELNKIMAYYLNKGPYIFISVKYFLTAAAVTITVLISHAFFRSFRIRSEYMLMVFFSFFACVVVWELYLIVRLVI